MGLSMGSSKITGATFKKMMITANKGHHSATKALPHDIKKALKDMHATKYIYNDKLKVSKQDAVKIMRGLKERGLGHHMMADASSFVHKEFRQEEAHQDTIRRENLASRAKEMAQERQAELAKSPKKETHQATAGATTQMAAHAVPAATPHPTVLPTVQHNRPSHSVATEPTIPSITPGHGIPSQKPPEETIDLAID